MRHPEWMGSHSPGGHPEIELADVRVPLGNLLGDEGEGFVIAQKRLAGGRLAHAMRWIGVAAARARPRRRSGCSTRKAFGKELARHQGLQFMLADSAMDLYASRLMVLHTAWKVEHGLPHRQEVAMTKTFVSEAFGRIADRAVQMHGAAGIAMDLPIARIFQDARAARIYDGASEVHRMVIARDMLKLAMQGGVGARGAAGSSVSPHAIARRRHRPHRARRPPGAREPLLVLEPLLAFLDAHGLGEGEPEIEPIGDGHSNVTYALRARRAPSWSSAARRAGRSRPARTTCCARRACCARSRAARRSRACSRCATTPA